jgi:hypothetical protein
MKSLSMPLIVCGPQGEEAIAMVELRNRKTARDWGLSTITPSYHNNIIEKALDKKQGSYRL